MNGDPLDELEEAGDEIKRLRSVIDRAAAAWMRCDCVEWEGDLADAVEAGVRGIERLRITDEEKAAIEFGIAAIRQLPRDGQTVAHAAELGCLLARHDAT